MIKNILIILGIVFGVIGGALIGKTEYIDVVEFIDKPVVITEYVDREIEVPIYIDKEIVVEVEIPVVVEKEVIVTIIETEIIYEDRVVIVEIPVTEIIYVDKEVIVDNTDYALMIEMQETIVELINVIQEYQIEVEEIDGWNIKLLAIAEPLEVEFLLIQNRSELLIEYSLINTSLFDTGVWSSNDAYKIIAEDNYGRLYQSSGVRIYAAETLLVTRYFEEYSQEFSSTIPSYQATSIGVDIEIVKMWIEYND